RKGGCSSGPEAWQCDVVGRWKGESIRLRSRKDTRRQFIGWEPFQLANARNHGWNECWRDSGNSALYVAGTGRWKAGGQARRYLVVRRGDVGDTDRQEAIRRRNSFPHIGGGAHPRSRLEQVTVRHSAGNSPALAPLPATRPQAAVARHWSRAPGN